MTSTTPDRAAEVVADAAPYLESGLAHQRRRLRVPGVQAAIRIGDRLVLDTALGVADLTTGVRVGGMSSWPLDVFRAQRAAQVAG
jgi:hypothetical protein